MHGIAPTDEITQRLQAHRFLNPLLKTLQSDGVESAIKLSLNQNDKRTLDMQIHLRDLLLSQLQLSDKNRTEYWIQSWLKQNPETLTGILTALFMNVMSLQAGEACYQPSGLLHAYLEGQNIELMANSDNVLRAGLTPKHIDVEELFRIGEFNSTSPDDYKITPTIIRDKEQAFPTPFKEFEISEITKATEITPAGCEILFCLCGKIALEDDGFAMVLLPGEAVLLRPKTNVQLIPQESARCFRVKTSGC